ncbi:hypothetical protein J437_LFUL010018 [Ladona fulva]|uniref:Reverse transcriptase n=1 Tax=Ladona fulva TaxID=123851 RepID=A0A8K0K9S3_LADFU|nr:hypothetical protein J437_LFUL010018 [Ladona fulva]
MYVVESIEAWPLRNLKSGTNHHLAPHTEDKRNWASFLFYAGKLHPPKTESFPACLHYQSVTEVNIQEDESDCFVVDGFKKYQKLRNKRKGGGIILYIKDSADFVIENVKFDSIEGILAPGHDMIRTKDVKNRVVLQELVTKLLKSSLKKGLVSDGLKLAIIKPIPKSKIMQNYNNYRPISILSVIDKVMEKYVAKSLMSYAQKYNHVSHQQYGF